jgi:hypothetical protein
VQMVTVPQTRQIMQPVFENNRQNLPYTIVEEYQGN